MTSAALLMVYALIGGTLGASYLRNASWTLRAPRLAIVVWQALAASIMLALGAAGLALAVSLAPIGSGLAEVLHLCTGNLQRGYASSDAGLMAVAGLVVLCLLLGRLIWSAHRVLSRTNRERRACRDAVQLVGRTDSIRGAVILDHHSPYAFCIGGRQSRIVLTRGLTEVLSEAEILAVMAHEMAHLKQRHSLCLTVSQTLFMALGRPFVAFRPALAQVRILLELSADDYAREQAGHRPLKAALAKMAHRSAPSGALAATAEGVSQRLQRLDHDPHPLGGFGVLSTGLLIASVMAMPVVLAAAPAVTLTRAGLCFIR